ncbi:MAG: MaoC family dehydratase N-terminal domain-containing protein [Chloroflexi bacterium]|nr:MaoC family dehydratase N-terminal domain-containing protein [Chloroflexota bacterium]
MEHRIIPRNYYEDWNIGEKFTSPARTVTQADIVNFAGISGDYNLAHTDKEYSRTKGFEKPIVYGWLTLSIAHGLLFRLGLPINSITFMGIDGARFTHWVLPDDTIHCTAEVASKRLTSKPDRGIVNFKALVFNQRAEQVAEMTLNFMYALAPKAA